MIEDPSVDVKLKDRSEIQAELKEFGITVTQTNIAKLRNQLKRALMEKHPIHDWLSGLTNENVKQHFRLIYPKAGNQNFDRMKKAISNFYFKNFPETPLSALKCNMNGHFYSSENLNLVN